MEGSGGGAICLTAETDDAAHHLCKQRETQALMELRDMPCP